MRTIKFRAWNWEKMIDPLSVFMPYDWLINHTNGWFTLMQFTWLLDKNGMEIYEGDILKFKTTKSQNSEVYFDEWSFKIKEGMTIRNLSHHLSKWQCEIIWNIYENPASSITS